MRQSYLLGVQRDSQTGKVTRCDSSFDSPSKHDLAQSAKLTLLALLAAAFSDCVLGFSTQTWAGASVIPLKHYLRFTSRQQYTTTSCSLSVS